MARRIRYLWLFGALLAVLASLSLAIGLAAQKAPERTSALRSVTIGMGYVPNVQFAPFYVAAQRGYYRQAGLNVRFSYGSSPNLLQLVGAGREDFAIADGTDVIAAEANGIPVTYVATMYQHLPVTVFSLQSKNIRSIRDLRGKTVGIPGRFGSSYAALLAALHQAGVKASELTIKTIGYTQAESVVQGKVDAAVGYSNNEPILLRREGYRVQSIEIGTQTGLVGAGLVAGNRLIARDPGLVHRFVQATLHGLQFTISRPRLAFASSRRVRGLSTLTGRNVGDQYAVLLRSIAFWHDTATRNHGLGYADAAQWRASIKLLRDIGQIPRAPALSSVMTNRFSAGAPDS